MNQKQQRFYVSQDLNDILDSVLKDNPELSNRSAALRYLVFERYKDYEQSKSKVASISKEVSMALEILSSMADSVHTKMKDRSDTSTYTEARELVEKRIKVNTSLRKYR